MTHNPQASSFPEETTRFGWASGASLTPRLTTMGGCSTICATDDENHDDLVVYGSTSPYPVQLVPDWESLLTEIEQMDPDLWGSQMENGWFAKYSDKGICVFIKQYTEDQSPDGLDEINIFERFKGDTNKHVNAPIAHRTYNKTLFLMQERLMGGDLWTHIANDLCEQSYSEGEVRKMTQWMAEGIQFLHQHAVAHCDIKPENVMGGINHINTSDVNYVQLVDFGTAEYYPRLNNIPSPEPIPNTIVSSLARSCTLKLTQPLPITLILTLTVTVTLALTETITKP